nr:NosD domain-containing protein [uncultured Methanospirillum sp.]
MPPHQISLTTCCILFILVTSQGMPSALCESTGNRTYEEGVLLSLPAVITTPGVYNLTSDIIGMNGTDAITILSSDVILVGSGHSVEAKGSDSNQTTGIRIEGKGEVISNISISSVRISGFHSGVRIENVSDTEIQNCSLNSNQIFGVALTNVSMVTITGSDVSATHPGTGGSGGDGIRIDDSKGVTIRSAQVTESGTGGSGNGIQITRSSAITIDGSTVTTSAGSGVSTEGNTSGLVIRDAIITGNSANGMSLGEGCSGPQISGSQVRDNTLTGIEITSSKSGILAGNLIENNQVGLSLSNSEDFSASSNIIRNNKINLDVTGSTPAEYWHHIDKTNLADGRPIWYLLGSHDISISSGDSPSCIYAVNCSNLTISDQVLSKNGAGVFLINTDAANISRISSLDNTFGVRIGYGSRNIRVTESSTETNLIAGYAVADSLNITFRSCTAQDNLVGFFCTETDRLLMELCDAHNQKGLRRRGPSGFLISDCRNVSVVNSSAMHNQFDGLYLKDSPDAIISGTSLSSNDIAGIASLAEGLLLSNSTISVNGAGGVLIYGNSSSIQGNKIQENKGRGLIIDSATGTKIWNNLFNNTRNVEMTGISTSTEWNITPRAGFGVTDHMMVGGNYWGSPDKTGLSDTCTPDVDGFCNTTYKPGLYGIDLHPISSKTPEDANSSSVISTLPISDSQYDIDQNGQVNLQDVITLMQGITSGTMTGSSNDFSQDGRVNLQDVVTLFNLIS